MALPALTFATLPPAVPGTMAYISGRVGGELQRWHLHHIRHQRDRWWRSAEIIRLGGWFALDAEGKVAAANRPIQKTPPKQGPRSLDKPMPAKADFEYTTNNCISSFIFQGRLFHAP
jgi:hypothetical protein